jgi:hypothetical protein
MALEDAPIFELNHVVGLRLGRRTQPELAAECFSVFQLGCNEFQQRRVDRGA